jgi:hypothetical protein
MNTMPHIAPANKPHNTPFHIFILQAKVEADSFSQTALACGSISLSVPSNKSDNDKTSSCSALPPSPIVCAPADAPEMVNVAQNQCAIWHLIEIVGYRAPDVQQRRIARQGRLDMLECDVAATAKNDRMSGSE